MTKEEVKELLPIMQAFAEGDEIQYRNNYNEWIDVKTGEGLCFTRPSSCYRIKPEPKYRPFKNQEECWDEMEDHYPFGWVKAPNGELFCIDKVFDEGVVYKHSSCRFEEYLEGNYTFADGIPFGIKED